MYRPVLVTAPSITPVTLAEVKAHCRAADFSDDDVTLSGLLAAATSHLDGWAGILGRCLCEQTWRQDFDCFESCLRLPLFPVISISSVKYTDTNGVEQTIGAENYSVQTDGLGAYVQFIYNFASPPLEQFLPAAVRVEYAAGYADTPAVDADPDGSPPVEAVPRSSNVPDAIKHAILLLVSHWYQNRDAVVASQASELPMAVDALIAPFRRIRF
jgi:uncharacterized phiE125 gp8 family phage protein